MQVNIEGDELVIRVPLIGIENSFKFFGPINDQEGNTVIYPEIINPQIFYEDVIGALTMEREDGSTFLTDAFDKAFHYLSEYGSEGIE